MSTQTLLIHIGLHKAASTFLQKNVWPFLFGTEKSITNGTRTAWRIIQDLSQDIHTREVDLISRETFSGTIRPIRPGHSWSIFKRFVTVASKIRPKPKILMVIRQHQEFLWSAYLEAYKKRLFNGTYQDYLSFFNDEDLSWSMRIHELKKNFRNVLVISQEELKEDLIHSVQDICKFANLHNAPIDQILAQAVKGDGNIAPQTKASLWFSRTLHTKSGKAVFRITNSILKRLPYENYKLLDRGETRNSLVKVTDRILPGARLLPESLPAERALKLMSDWEEAKKHTGLINAHGHPVSARTHSLS